MDTKQSVKKFTKTLWDYYIQHGRHDMAWRQDTRAYYIVVSEIMLQQTQVDRVKPKFAEFIEVFADWQSLAKAQQATVLTHWQGLGYNRRAIYLHKTAQSVISNYNGKLPNNLQLLQTLPGIGPGTAGAIMAFAFNTPVVFIETNIRRVFLHHFFAGKTNVADKDILGVLQECIDVLPASNFEPRTFYWALMDYGTSLKSGLPNPNKRSQHYSLQSTFEGSDRQLRGQIVKLLIANPLQIKTLQTSTGEPSSARFNKVLAKLIQEGVVAQSNKKVRLR
jgi:A/G-specific adenine glycosylase